MYKFRQVVSVFLIIALLAGLTPAIAATDVVQLSSAPIILSPPIPQKMYSDLSREEKDELNTTYDTSDDVFESLEVLGISLNDSVGHIHISNEYERPLESLIEAANSHNGIDSLDGELLRMDNLMRYSINLDEDDVAAIQDLIFNGNTFDRAMEMYAEVSGFDIEDLYEQEDVEAQSPSLPRSSAEYETPYNLIAAPFSYSVGENSTVNLSTGEYTHEEVDLFLPGKNGLDLELRRRFDSSISGIEPDSGIYGNSIQPVYYLYYEYYLDDYTDELGTHLTSRVSNTSLYNWTYVNQGVPGITGDLTVYRNILNITFSAAERGLALAYKDALGDNGAVVLPLRNGSQFHIARYRAAIGVFDGALRAEISSGRIFSEANRVEYSNRYGLGHGWTYAFSQMENREYFTRQNVITYAQYLRLADGRRFKVDFDNPPSNLAGYNRDDLRLTRNGSAGYVLTYGDGKREFFSTLGSLTEIRDRFGNSITFSYTSTDYVATRVVITDTLGRVVTLEQPGNNRNQRVLTAPDGTQKTFTTKSGENSNYGSSQFILLDKVVDQNGNTTTYESSANSIKYNPFHPTVMNVLVPFENHCQVVLTQVNFPNGLRMGYTAQQKTRILDGVGHMQYFALTDRYSYFTQSDSSIKVVDCDYYNYIGNFSGWQSAIRGENKSKTVVKELFFYNNSGHFATKKEDAHILNSKQLKEKTTTRLYHRELPYGAVFNLTNNSENVRTIQETTYQYDQYDLPSVVTEHNWDYLNPTSTRMERVYRYTHNSRGSVTRYIDPDGRVTDYTYHATYQLPLTVTYRKNASTIINITNTLTSGNLAIARTSISEGGTLKQRTEYQYDSAGNVTRQRRFHSDFTTYIDTTYTYDNSALPTQTQTENVVTKSTYDTMGRLKTSTDANNNTTSYQYDALGNISRITNPDGSFSTYNRNYAANLLTISGETGDVTEYKYLQNGALERVRDVNNDRVLSTYVYDPGMRLREERTYFSGSDFNRTEYRHDTQDRTLGKTVYNASGSKLHEETYTYHDTHTNGTYQRVQKTVLGDTTSPSIVTTSYINKMGFEVQTGAFLGTTEHLDTHRHDYLGNVTETRTALDAQRGRAFTARFEYDHTGNITKETNALDQSVVYTFDSLGRNTAITDPSGRTTTFEYDNLDRLLVQTSPFESGNNAVTKYTYDPAGNVTREETQNNTPGSSATWTRTEYAYNNRNFLTQAARYNGSSVASRTAYTYDAAGNILTQTVGTSAPATTSYQYDPRGNVDKITDALGQIETFTYDLQGNPTTKTDRKGTVFSYTYDGLGRALTTTATTDGKPQQTQSTTYTLTGQVRSETNSLGTITNTYDALGRLVQVSEPESVNKSYTYDIGGNRLTFRLQSGTTNRVSTSYTYDTLNRLETVRENNALQATYTYDTNGNRASLTRGNGVTTTYSYNHANLITNVTNGNVSSYSYTYNLDGNQRTKTDNKGKISTYTYDGLGRLTSENGISYTYDERGNRASMSHNGTTTTYTYDLNNRLTRTVSGDETTIYYYDKNGNQISKLSSNFDAQSNLRPSATLGGNGYEFYTYDLFNRQTSVIIDGTTTDYTYRPDGLRHSKTTGRATVTHVWDGANIVLDMTASSVVKYVRGIGLLSSGSTYYLHNAHGDVVQLTDDVGDVVRSYEYDAFGVETNPASSDSNPWRYCGEYWDKETGSYYLRFRNYQPKIGRFTSEDPIRDGLNWYTYSYNNPVYFVDTSGLKPYSVNAIGDKNKGKFNLYVSPQWLDAVQTGIGWIPAVGWGFTAFTWTGLRLAGYRGVSYDVTGALGVASGAANRIISNDFIKTMSKWAGVALIATEALQYANSWFRTHRYRVEEAVFNHLLRSIWLSDKRDTVDKKFELAMQSMTSMILEGKVEVKKAVDVFGKSAFKDSGILGETTYAFDALTGKKKTFKKDEYYFFSIDDSAAEYINELTNTIVNMKG